MQAHFYPASVRRNRRSYPAVRVVLDAQNGAGRYEHKIYSAHIGYDDGAAARNAAKKQIARDDFDREYYITATKTFWGLE